MFESQDKQDREYLISQIKAIDKKVANDKLMRSREVKEKQAALDKANKLALSEEQKINDLLASEGDKARKLRLRHGHLIYRERD